MASKYNRDVDYFIQSQAPSFFLFIRDYVLNRDAWSVLNLISEQTKVYVFSGIIRNFFLGYPEVRDFDIVVSRNRISIPKEYISSIHVEKNSFGGRKYLIGNLKIDFWFLQDTWGIKEEKKKANVNALINSAFFNFSAVAYDFNNQKFVYSENFRKFLSLKVLDVVYEKNPNLPLCIVNTLYYSKQYDLPLGTKLAKWIVEHYQPEFDYRPVQEHHWGKVVYCNEAIEDFYFQCVWELIHQ